MSSGNAFDIVKTIGLALPGVAGSIKYDGSPVLKVNGVFLAGLAMHPSAEPDTLVIRYALDERDLLIADAPGSYYLTDYYRNNPLILVRLAQVDPDALRELLSVSWRLALEKAPNRRVGIRSGMLRLLILATLASPLFASLILNSNAFDTSGFRVTTFANTGFAQPISMLRLSDGSLAVASSGSIQRFTDANNDGVADGPGSTLYSATNGPLLGMVQTGKYIVIGSSGDTSIQILQPGATPDAPLSFVASIAFSYPPGWYHPTPGITVRETPGSPGSYDLVFNVGSQYNSQLSTSPVQLSGLISGPVSGDSLYAVTINENGASPVASNLRMIATGIRNVAGMRWNAAGDLYFTDNAIDGPNPDGDEPPQADELNRILAAQFGGPVLNFGYPNCYTEYRTGNQIGAGCEGPVVAFQPLPNGDPLGSQSEGPVELAFAPLGFPAGFNNGVFVGFSGKGFKTGAANEENAVVYYDFGTGQYLHFVENSLNGVGQPIGVYSSGNSLFIADFTTSTIYEITASIPEPVTLSITALGLALAVGLAAKRKAANRNGSQRPAC